MSDTSYRQCKISVMDTIADPDITFDENGICNYYYEYKKSEETVLKKGKQGEDELAKIVAEIKAAGKNQQYDCIMGLSGGVDSTYVAYLAKKLGLRGVSTITIICWQVHIQLRFHTCPDGILHIGYREGLELASN